MVQLVLKQMSNVEADAGGFEDVEGGSEPGLRLRAKEARRETLRAGFDEGGD